MSPPRYSWLLLDADDTLLDYATAEREALTTVLAEATVTSADAPALYAEINAALWRDLELGVVTADVLRVERFRRLFAALDVDADPVAVADRYLGYLGAASHLLEGAAEAVALLATRHRLAILTNGLADVQRPRLTASPLLDHVELLVISDEVGAAKPDAAIYDAALAAMGGPERDEVLAVGDSLTSDVAGASAYGLDVCWVNRTGAPRPADLTVTYEVASIADLPPLLGLDP